ncbi:hypothetical protein ACFL1H_07710, partial [Nanoarchaeota archaeon]
LLYNKIEKCIDLDMLFEKMPWIENRLKDKSHDAALYVGITSTDFFTGLDYAESENNSYLIAKWENHSYGETGGVGWTEWSILYITNKNNPGSYKEIESMAVKTRDRRDPKKDQHHLQGYDRVKIVGASDEEVIVKLYNPNDESIYNGRKFNIKNKTTIGITQKTMDEKYLKNE